MLSAGLDHIPGQVCHPSTGTQATPRRRAMQRYCCTHLYVLCCMHDITLHCGLYLRCIMSTVSVNELHDALCVLTEMPLHAEVHITYMRWLLQHARSQEARCYYQDGMKFQVSDTANFMPNTMNITVGMMLLEIVTACGRCAQSC